jgi:hypothetical protein
MKSVESMVLLQLAVVFVLGVAQTEARISCITDSVFKVSAFFLHPWCNLSQLRSDILPVLLSELLNSSLVCMARPCVSINVADISTKFLQPHF